VKRLLLSGYYGYGNAGDEAVLAGLVAGFRAAAPAGEMELTALSGAVTETRRAHGIGAADRYRPSALLPAIARCDLFLSGGGSLLQDVSSKHSIFYYLGVVKMAQMLGKKTMFIAQGIGPLHLPRSRKLVAAVANKLDAITVRDPQSAQLLHEIGVTRPPIEVTADPALLLFAPRIPHRGNSFGVALRPWQGQDLLGSTVASACVASLGGQRPLLLPMQDASDRPVAEQFAQTWLGQKNAATLCATAEGLDALLSIIAGCDMMVGMRLHALILAAAAGVPSVALSYDPKVSAFMQGCGQGDAVYDLNAPDLETLETLLACVWAERTARAAALEDALPGLRAKAMQNIFVALGLIMKGTIK
jgi:polysaccharide pyruvyl transferase CsaB